MDAFGNDAPTGGAKKRGSVRGWLAVLAGACLFLGGALLGGVLALTIALYRQPAGRSPTGVAIVPSVPRSDIALDEAETPLPTALPFPSIRPVGPKVGWEAPAFVLPDLDGGEHDLASYRGRIVLLHFWASWCPPCRAEWPELRAFAQEHGDGRFVLLAVNSEESAEVVRNFVGPDRPPFPILLDNDGSVGRAYRLSVLPTTFVIGADGDILQVVPGNIGAEGLGRLLER